MGMTRPAAMIAVDTEGLEDKPWGGSWSTDGKKSHVWLHGKQPPALEGPVLFHNALHDLKIIRAMGGDTSKIIPHDTMLKAFVLQLEPQGLKPLALRHLNFRMHSFDDLVRPIHAALAISWLKKAVEFTYPKPRPIAISDYKKKTDRLYKPQGVGQRMKSLIKSWEKDQETGAGKVELEKRWAEIGETNETATGASEKLDFTADFQSQAEYQMRKAGHGGFPEFSIFVVDQAEAVRYSGTDAAATWLVDRHLDRALDEKGLRPVYEMERKALPFVDRMQEVGLGVDRRELRELEQELEGKRESARDRLQRIVGTRWFNPGSHDQVRHWLYDVNGLKIYKKTKGSDRDDPVGSTDDAALRLIRGYNQDNKEVADFCDALDEYRESDKYLTTFVRVIFDLMRKGKRGWRIHPNFRVTRVVSRRLSSFDPNVLAFPTRTALGKRIRKCFKAAPGFELVSVDESQVELRFMAHLARDPRMRKAFETGVDLHTLTASIIFGIPLAEVGKDSPERYVAKTINFAVMYGISDRALLEQLFKAGIYRFDRDQCKSFIREWFEIYESVPRFLKKLWAQAQKDGFVRDIWGGICYVPNLNIEDDQLREAAQRLAGNFPVQAGAHGLVKHAEILTHEWIGENDLRDDVLPWLQIHDELLTECRIERSEEVREKIKEFMVAHQDKVSVPLKAEAKWGPSWGELKAA